jgi:hypothetical protein
MTCVNKLMQINKRARLILSIPSPEGKCLDLYLQSRPESDRGVWGHAYLLQLNLSVYILHLGNTSKTQLKNLQIVFDQGASPTWSPARSLSPI